MLKEDELGGVKWNKLIRVNNKIQSTRYYLQRRLIKIIQLTSSFTPDFYNAIETNCDRQINIRSHVIKTVKIKQRIKMKDYTIH